MTVEEVKSEVQLLNLDNIKEYPCTRANLEDFYNMWSKFGPDAARTLMIPPIWEGKCPKPSEYFNG